MVSDAGGAGGMGAIYAISRRIMRLASLAPILTREDGRMEFSQRQRRAELVPSLAGISALARGVYHPARERS